MQPWNLITCIQAEIIVLDIYRIYRQRRSYFILPIILTSMSVHISYTVDITVLLDLKKWFYPSEVQ